MRAPKIDGVRRDRFSDPSNSRHSDPRGTSHPVQIQSGDKLGALDRN